jgi:hypothetical protein
MQNFYNITDNTATTILQEYNDNGRLTPSKANYEIIICNTSDGDTTLNIYLDDSDSTVSDVYIIKNHIMSSGETIILNKRGVQFQSKSLVVQLAGGSVDISIFSSLSIDTNSSIV